MFLGALSRGFLLLMGLIAKVVVVLHGGARVASATGEHGGARPPAWYLLVVAVPGVTRR